MIHLSIILVSSWTALSKTLWPAVEQVSSFEALHLATRERYLETPRPAISASRSVCFKLSPSYLWVVNIIGYSAIHVQGSLLQEQS
jgi:hypothetical protein